jgi:hypothetical protein
MAASGLTATGTFLGTPDYCAPEQIRGLPVDGRGDQYSLACMAFALLTGNLPFRRQESMATLFAHLNDPVPSLSRYRRDLPPGTDAVLARGLAKEPRDRYGRCGEFAAALRDALAGAGHSGAAGSWPGPGAGPPGLGPTRLESAPRASRPPHVPETAMWPGAASEAGPASQRTWAAQPPPVGGRRDGRPAPPPPAAGQGGTLPLVSRCSCCSCCTAGARAGTDPY